MKFVRKINRGLLLFLAIVICTSIYLVAYVASTNEAMSEIEALCSNFAKVQSEYMTPSKEALEDDADLSKHVENMRAALSDTITGEFPLKHFQQYLLARVQSDSWYRRYSKMYSVQDFMYMFVVFDDMSHAHASISSSPRIIVVSDNGDTETTIKQSVGDYFEFEKVDGEWRISKWVCDYIESGINNYTFTDDMYSYVGRSM